MGIDRRLAPLLAELLVFVLVDVDDHGVAADTRIGDILGLPGQTTLGQLLDVLTRRHDLEGLATGPATLGEHAHGAALPRRISCVVGEGRPVGGVIRVMNHLSHRVGLRRE